MGRSAAKKKKSAVANVSSNGHSPSPTTAPSPAHPAAVPAPNGIQIDVAALLRRAHELKEEGNRLFQSRDFVGALRQYDLALKLTPRGHPDRAIFHSNRAACLMQMRPVDYEAVATECSLALEAQPCFPRALLRRAKAFDSLQRPDLALRDVLTLLSVEPSNSEALDLARRLRASTPQPSVDQPTSQRPSPAALGASAVVAGLGPSLPARPIPKKTSSTKLPSSPSTTLTKPSPSLPPKASSIGLENLSAVDSSRIQDDARKRAPVSTASASSPVDVRMRPLKLVYDHDIRLAEMPENCTFGVLRDLISKRFPSSKAVLIKYKDADGDLVTITSTAELRLAQHALMDRNDASKEEGRKTEVLRFHIVEVSPEQEPALPEESEEEKVLVTPVEEKQSEEEDVDLVNGDDNLSNSSVELEHVKEKASEQVTEHKIATSCKKECGHPECKEVEIDDWLLQFAELFRNQVGIDADAHLDVHELGMELCSAALEEAVASEEAQELFEMAASKFQEVAALALFNWGNVYMCAARKRIPIDETAAKEVMSAQLRVAYDWVRERYSLAGEKYEEALRIKPDFYEGLLALGQQHFESAKLHWSFAVADKVDLTVWDSSETIQLFDSAEEKMRNATDMWEKVEDQRIAELKDPSFRKKDELLKRRKKQGSAEGLGELTAEEATEQAGVMRQQIHLFWGNMLFERSQVEYKLGFLGWKENLDAAIERFKLAGASEADISALLKNHLSNETAGECKDKGVTGITTQASDADENAEDKHVLAS